MQSDHPTPPYPISIKPRFFEGEDVPPGGGTENFDQPDALRINQARMVHLQSLGLDLKGKRVLDAGCGVGHLAASLVDWGCEVACFDGREENIVSLKERYPILEAYVADVEKDPLSRFGMFDVVLCYGLLYHLENPLAGLRNMAAVCRETLLVDTMICDHILPIVRLDDETKTFSQALRGMGSRLTPSYVVMALNRVGFPFVYAPKDVPDYPDYKFEWLYNLDWFRDGHPLRCIFIASRTRLPNSNLISLLPTDETL